MAYTVLPLGEWAPDAQALGNPGYVELVNSAPSASAGYRSWPSLTPATNPIDQRARGVIAAISHNGTPTNVAGDATKLYKLAGSNWQDISRAGGYNLLDRDGWDFTQYGNWIMAAAWGNPVQYWDMDSGQKFANISSTAPQAKFICTCRSFIVLGYVTEGATPKPNRVQWCPIGNPLGDWTPQVATLAGFNDLRGQGGNIQRIVGGEYVTVFQENSIWRMSFAGAPVKFQFDELEPGRGTPAPGSVVNHGKLIFYLGQDGFYVFDGAASTPIGRGKVDRWFYNDFDQGYAERMVGCIDPISGLVVWAYPGNGSTNGQPNKLIFYNWSSGQWGNAEMELEHLSTWRGQGLDLDTLGDLYPSLDDMPLSMDGRDWISGKISLRAFGPDHKAATFAGAALPATLRTGTTQLNGGRRSIVQQVRPVLETNPDLNVAPNINIRAGSRTRLQEATQWDEFPTPLDEEGDAFLLREGRYHAFEVTLDDHFDHFAAVEVHHVADGLR